MKYISALEIKNYKEVFFHFMPLCAIILSTIKAFSYCTIFMLTLKTNFIPLCQISFSLNPSKVKF
jgi:hypothetical protein